MFKYIWQGIKYIYGFFVKLAQDRVGVYTAQASFFIILSIFPFILLILNILGYTSLDKDTLIFLVEEYLPNTITPLLVQIINELFQNVSGTILSITAIAAIWSVSKGVLSLMFGLYEISKLHQTRNYYISRAISMGYTVVFLIMFVLTMTLLVFGNKIMDVIIGIFPKLAEISELYTITRYSAAFLILVAFFSIVLRIVNFKRSTFKKVLPGAVISAFGWIAFSYLFSIYVDNFANMSYTYGSLTAVIILMLWLYFCIYIFFIGAEINKILYPETVAIETPTPDNEIIEEINGDITEE